MIWRGVGRPEDFVATLNRFPVHNQRVTTHSNARFVANLTCFYRIASAAVPPNAVQRGKH